MKDEKNFLKMKPQDIQMQIEHCKNKIKNYEDLLDSWQDILHNFNLTSLAEAKS